MNYNELKWIPEGFMVDVKHHHVQDEYTGRLMHFSTEAMLIKKDDWERYISAPHVKRRDFVRFWGSATCNLEADNPVKRKGAMLAISRAVSAYYAEQKAMKQLSKMVLHP